MKTEISLVHGDITLIPVDAMVNAANSALAGGGGVDGAIHKTAGPSMRMELDNIIREQGGCPTGKAVITGAGNLPARYVIHAVGPVWQGGMKNEKDLLVSAYLSSLNLAMERGCRSISFPNISTGVYRYPKKEAAEVALQTVSDFINEHPQSFKKIYFVCFDEENEMLYRSLLKCYFSHDHL